MEIVYRKLAESIKGNPKFFEARPILLSDRTGQLVIIGGERRSEAAALEYVAPHGKARGIDF